MDTEIKKNQVTQKYSDLELKLIKDEAKKQHMKVATLIRKYVLENIERLNK